MTPTLLDGVGLDSSAASLSGAVILPGPPVATASVRVAQLLDIQRHATMVTRVSGAYSTRLVLVQAVLFVAAAIILTRRGRSDRAPLRPALRVLQVSALALAAAPVASFLTNTIPWWRSDMPVTAFWWVLLGWTRSSRPSPWSVPGDATCSDRRGWSRA